MSIDRNFAGIKGIYIPLIPGKLTSIDVMVCKLKKVMFQYKFPIIPPNSKGLWGDEIFGGIGRALSHFGAMRVRTPAIGES